MPKKYEAIRDKMAKTMPMKEAKTRAAKIYNSGRKKGEAPVHANIEQAMMGLAGKHRR